MKRALEVFEQMDKYKVLPDNACIRALISLSVEQEHLDSLQKAIAIVKKHKDIPLEERDCLRIIRAFINCKSTKDAVDFLNLMDERKVKPTNAMYALLLKGCIAEGNTPEAKLHLGQAVYDHIKQSGIRTDEVVNASIVELYSKKPDNGKTSP
jgi:pentatricopeptide repeat protein